VEPVLKGTVALVTGASSGIATATELASHNRPEILESIRSQFGQRIQAEDIADAIAYVVTRPRHVAVNEMLIRPTEQVR
jgi:NADP-dependent 3-hydroxy acid dehydrogenase YdfG